MSKIATVMMAHCKSIILCVYDYFDNELNRASFSPMIQGHSEELGILTNQERQILEVNNCLCVFFNSNFGDV